MRLVASLILVIVALVGLTLWRASAVERASEASYPPEGSFVTVSGVRMHGVVAGSGPDLVLIHGASGSVRDFTEGLLPALSGRYRVFAIDRPGLGWSEAATGGERLAVQAALIRAAAEALGAERPIVLGHSYGGAVALAWAVDAPDSLSALVLVSAPSHRWDGGVPLLYRLTSAPVAGAVFRALISAWVPEGVVMDGTRSVFAPQEMPEGYIEHFGPRMSLRRVSQRVNARQRAVLKDQITAMAPSYPALDLPVEQVHGTADSTVYITIHAERLALDVPGAHLTRLPGVGHMPQHVAIDDVVAAIDRAARRSAAH